MTDSAEMPQGVGTLADLRRAGGADAVRAAILAALAAHPTRAAAARSLGIAPSHLTRTARRVGVVLERRAAGRRRQPLV